MHFQQTQLADLLCSNERSSECPVLKLTYFTVTVTLNEKPCMIFEVTLTHGWLQYFPLVAMQHDAPVCQRQLSYLLLASCHGSGTIKRNLSKSAFSEGVGHFERKF